MRCKGGLVVLGGKKSVPYLKVHSLRRDDKWEMAVLAQFRECYRQIGILLSNQKCSNQEPLSRSGINVSEGNCIELTQNE